MKTKIERNVLKEWWSTVKKGWMNAGNDEMRMERCKMNVKIAVWWKMMKCMLKMLKDVKLWKYKK